MNDNPIAIFTENTSGRDFVVGDIHGQYTLLQQTLESCCFDKTQDRLFCVGDLIDRGNENIDVINLLNEPWFFSILGNHEQMFIDAEMDVDSLWEVFNDSEKIRDVRMNRDIHRDNGGMWAWNLPKSQLTSIKQTLKNLPCAFEIPYKGHTYGILHGNFPERPDTDQFNWEVVKHKLQTFTGDSFDSYVDEILWSQKLAKAVYRMDNDVFIHQRTSYKDCTYYYDKNVPKQPIANVDRVYFGHVTRKRPYAYKNISYIDTALASGNLTMVELGEVPVWYDFYQIEENND